VGGWSNYTAEFAKNQRVIHILCDHAAKEQMQEMMEMFETYVGLAMAAGRPQVYKNCGGTARIGLQQTSEIFKISEVLILEVLF